MPRDAAVVRARLQQAALELFREHGYDSTTAADIAERAGVTQRTFFRHFTDKREVFFDGETELQDTLSQALRAIPAQTPPLPALRAAFHATVELLERNRPTTAPRAPVIAATPALRERALSKEAGLVELLTRLLIERGSDQRVAQVNADIGMHAFSVATGWWMADRSQNLHDRLDEVFDVLRASARALH